MLHGAARAIVAMTGLLVMIACTDRYQVVQDKEGRTVRLDKKTGDVVIIAGDRLIVPKTEEEQLAVDAAKRKAEQALGELKRWEVQEFKNIGVDTAMLFTAWRDGSLRYQLQLEPIPKGFEDRYSPNPLTLKFTDKAGFVVVQVEFTRGDLLRVVDDKGKQYALSANSFVRCSREDYESLASWSLSWRF